MIWFDYVKWLLRKRCLYIFLKGSLIKLQLCDGSHPLFLIAPVENHRKNILTTSQFFLPNDPDNFCSYCHTGFRQDFKSFFFFSKLLKMQNYKFHRKIRKCLSCIYSVRFSNFHLILNVKQALAILSVSVAMLVGWLYHQIPLWRMNHAKFDSNWPNLHMGQNIIKISKEKLEIKQLTRINLQFKFQFILV